MNLNKEQKSTQLLDINNNSHGKSSQPFQNEEPLNNNDFSDSNTKKNRLIQIIIIFVSIIIIILNLVFLISLLIKGGNLSKKEQE